jgi:hypothetical protein
MMAPESWRFQLSPTRTEDVPSINGVQTMKKILIAAGIAALISAPAFAAPEPFNVEVGPQGSLRA